MDYKWFALQSSFQSDCRIDSQFIGALLPRKWRRNCCIAVHCPIFILKICYQIGNAQFRTIFNTLYTLYIDNNQLNFLFFGKEKEN